jgi:uncharacterized protein (DUF305 family)
MRTTWRVSILMMALSIVTLGALQHDPPSHSHMATEAAGWTELMGNMDRMHAAMASVEPSGTSDVDFVRLMLPHHLGAIDMAKSELLNGNDPQMRRLAQEIITDQESEIQLMQLWLKQQVASAHNPPQTPDVKAGKER